MICGMTMRRVKKIFLLLFWGGLFVFPSAFWFLLQDDSPRDALYFLPKDTAFYLQGHHQPQKLQKFFHSLSGKVLTAIEYGRISRELGASEQFSRHLETLRHFGRTIVDEPLFTTAFDEYFLVAMFPERSWSSSPHPLGRYLKNQMLLVTRPPSASQLIKDFLGITSYREITSVPYGQYRIRRFEKMAERFSVAVVDGYLLAAFEERLIREAIRHYETQSDTIYGHLPFQKIIAGMESLTPLIYSNLEKVTALASHLAATAESRHEQVLFKIITYLKGVDALGWSAYGTEQDIWKSTLVAHKSAAVSPVQERLFTISPQKNNTASFAVDDTFFYYWSNTFTAKTLGQFFLVEMAGTDVEGQHCAMIKKRTGFDLADLLDMFGEESMLLLRPGGWSPLFPLPGIALAVSLKDAQKLQKAIDTLSENFAISLHKKAYKNTTYYYWGLYPFENLQPVYAMYKNYLVIANTRDTLTSVLALPGDKETLFSSLQFAAVDPGFATNNNTVCYVEPKALRKFLVDFFEITRILVAVENKESAARMALIKKELLEPLFFGGFMSHPIAMKTRNEEDLITTIYHVNLNQYQPGKTYGKSYKRIKKSDGF